MEEQSCWCDNPDHMVLRPFGFRIVQEFGILDFKSLKPYEFHE